MNKKSGFAHGFFVLLFVSLLLIVRSVSAADACSTVVYAVSFNPQTFICTISASSGTDIACGIKSDQNAYPLNCPWDSGMHFQCPKSTFSAVAKVYVGGLYNKQGTSCYNNWAGSAVWKEYIIGTEKPQPTIVTNNVCDTKSIYNACLAAPKLASGCAFNDGAQTASARGWYYCGGDDYWRGPFVDEMRCSQCKVGTVQPPSASASPPPAAVAPPAQAPAVPIPAAPSTSTDTSAPVDLTLPTTQSPNIPPVAVNTQVPSPKEPTAQGAPPVVTIPEKPVVAAQPPASINSTALAKINYLTGLANNKYQIILVTHENAYTTWKDQGLAGAKYPGDISGVLTSSSDPMVSHLFNNGFWATAHEDLALSRNYGCFPKCQFWRIEGFTSGSNATIDQVFSHESIHNDQSANDGNLAEHLGFDSNVDVNKAYQSIIEGFATKTAGGGMSWYGAYVIFLQKLKIWADKDYASQFAAAENGDWKAFNELYTAYEQSGKSIHDLLSSSGIK